MAAGDRAYADVVGSFRRGAAGSYAGRGDYARASSMVAPVDPELAQSYMQLSRQADQDSANRAYASAYANDDFTGAANVAAKTGNVQGVSAARQGALQLDQQQRAKMLQGAQQNLAELQQMDATQGQGYDDYLSRARAALQQNPRMDPQMRSFIQSLPPQWSPGLSQSAQRFVAAIRDSLLTPEQQTAAEDRDLTRQQQAEIARQASEDRRYTAELIHAGQGDNRITYRPATAADLAPYNIPADQAGSYSIGSNGQLVPVRPVRQQFYPDTAMMAANYADRMSQAETTMAQIEARHRNDPGFWAGIHNTILGTINSGDDDTRAYRNAARVFINSTLRKESGAAISASEFDSAHQQYIPTPADATNGQSFAQHAAARRAAFQGFVRESQGAYDEYHGPGANGGAAPGGGAGGGAGNGLPPVNQRVNGQRYTWTNSQGQTVSGIWDAAQNGFH